VYCFGANFAGNLGRGNIADDLTVKPVGGLTRVTAVYAGDSTSCATTTSRVAYCWGSNIFGNLGSGSTDDYSADPVRFGSVTSIATMAMSVSTTCAARQDGTVWCAGNTDYGTIPGASGIVRTPVKIGGISSVTQLAAGNAHVCAIRSDKTVWCWGYNSEGQLGTGATSASPSGPVKVPGITDAVAITATAFSTCALRAAGTVLCWGYSASFETGTGTTSSVLSPTAVPNITGAKGITFGYNHGCAWSSTTVRCWGWGGDGQLGDGQGNSAPWPTRVEFGLANPTAMSAGTYTTCEIANGGRVWCWGKNGYGEAGNEDTNYVVKGDGPGSTFGYAADPIKVPVMNSAPGKPVAKSTVKGKATLTWAAPSTSNGTSAPTDYTVQYRLKGTSTWKTFKDAVSSSRTATVTGLTSGKYYEYRVLPKNWAGTGTTSATASAVKTK
jgi:alpha-tubulin suppressor-like RCC1 family protein